MMIAYNHDILYHIRLKGKQESQSICMIQIIIGPTQLLRFITLYKSVIFATIPSYFSIRILVISNIGVTAVLNEASLPPNSAGGR